MSAPRLVYAATLLLLACSGSAEKDDTTAADTDTDETNPTLPTGTGLIPTFEETGLPVGEAEKRLIRLAPSLWLRPEALSAGPLPVWRDAVRDQQAQAFPVTQHPTVRADGPGGLPVVVFDGVDDMVRLPVPIARPDRWDDTSTPGVESLLPESTTFLVASIQGPSGHIIGTGASDAMVVEAPGAGLIVRNGTVHAKAIHTDANVLIPSPTPHNGTPQVFVFERTGSAVALWQGGGTPEIVRGFYDLPVLPLATLGARDGNDTGTPKDALAMEVSEVIVISGRVPPCDQDAIVRDLAAKYGIDEPAVTLPVPSTWLRGEGAGTSAGERIALWQDAFDAPSDNQPQPGGRSPTYQPGAVAGLDAVRFDGLNDRADPQLGPGILTNNYMVVVGFQTTDPSGHLFGVAAPLGRLIQTGNSLVLNAGTARSVRAIEGEGEILTSGRYLADGMPHVVSYWTNPEQGPGRLLVDDALPRVGSTPANPYPGEATLGGGVSPSDRTLHPLGADIAEIWMFNGDQPSCLQDLAHREMQRRLGQP